MKIYVHDERKGAVEDVCKQIDSLEVLTPTDVRARTHVPSGVNFFLDDVDVLVLEITKPTQDIQFILAQAILAEKPTLCLYGKNQAPREILSYIKKRKAPRPLKTFSYTDSTLPRAISQFIAAHDPNAEKDNIPSIKFTLRLSSRIERYLDWYTQKHDVSKADYIRSLLDDAAEQDTDYMD